MACPSHLPSFSGLIEEFEHLTGRRRREGESYDQYLGRNDIKHGVNVHGVVEKILNQGVPLPNSNHLNLLRLFGSAHDVRLVTTNFDSMFEQACGPLGWEVESFTSPLLPSATDFRGIVHLHGSLEDTSRIVLTDTDLGRAYLSEGWAARFLSELVRRYTVLFVGYSSNDLMPRYLLSAIRDASKEKLYTLDPSGEQQNLEQIGIKSIPYSQDSPTDHSVLAGSLARLGTLFSQAPDEWRSLIESTVASGNAVTQSDEEVIRLALRMPATTEYFVNATNHVSWVRWLDAKGYLAPVFTAGVKRLTMEFLTVNDNLSTQFETGAQRQSAGSLAELVAFQCIRDDPAYLLNLLERHDLEMSDQLWQQLVYAIRDNDPTEVSLVQWLTILLQHPIEHMVHDALYALAGTCHQRTDADALLFMYEFLIAPRWVGSQRDWHGIDAHVKITENMVSQSNASSALLHCANMFDDQSVAVLKRGLEIGIKSFVRRHELLKAWSEASDDYDEWSTWFNPFNPQVAPDQPEGFELVFIITRQQIHSLVKLGGTYADELVGRLAGSPVPILRRLAVDAVTVRGDLDEDSKAEWLMEHLRVGDLEPVREMSSLLERVWLELGGEAQNRLVGWLMSWPEIEGRRTKASTLRKDRLVLLLESINPSSDVVADVDEELKRVDPDALAKRLPKPPFEIIEKGLIDPPKPFSVEELLSMRDADRLRVLLAWQPRGWMWGDGRRGLLQLVQHASTREFGWSRELADELIDGNHASTDLWGAILAAWNDERCAVADWGVVLTVLAFVLEREDLSLNIAMTLVRFAKEAKEPDLLKRANRLATAMWRENSDDAQGLLGSGLVYASGNSAAGLVPMYWVKVAKRLIDGEIVSERLMTETKSEVSRIALNESQQSTVGKVTLGAWFHALYKLDEDWAKNELMPMFGETHVGFEAAWEGFLWTFPGERWFPEALMNYVEVPIINRHLINAGSEVSVYPFVSYLCCYRDADLAHRLVRKLYNTAEASHRPADIVRFVSNIRVWLRLMDIGRLAQLWTSWLKEYLIRRRLGLPSRLVSGEVWELLMLIPIVLPAAHEIADVLIDFPLDESESNNFGRILKKVEVNDSPKEYSKLMLYFDEYKLGSWQWNYNKKHLDKLIANEAVPLDQRKRLQDLKFKYMID